MGRRVATLFASRPFNGGQLPHRCLAVLHAAASARTNCGVPPPLQGLPLQIVPPLSSARPPHARNHCDNNVRPPHSRYTDALRDHHRGLQHLTTAPSPSLPICHHRCALSLFATPSPFENEISNPLYVVHIPENLAMDAAAPLLCAGITVFTPLKDHDLVASPGKRIGIVGLGGLGHIAVKFAKAFGHHVTVISTSPSKEAEAKHRLGADDFIVSSNPNQMQGGRRSLDFILDTVSAEHSLLPILELLKVNGTLFIVGAPDKPFQLPAFPLIFGKRSVKGGIIGGIKETQEMLDVCGKHNITCDIELITPDRINDALDRLAKNDVRYRFVIDIAAGTTSNSN